MAFWSYRIYNFGITTAYLYATDGKVDIWMVDYWDFWFNILSTILNCNNFEHENSFNDCCCCCTIEINPCCNWMKMHFLFSKVISKCRQRCLKFVPTFISYLNEQILNSVTLFLSLFSGIAIYENSSHSTFRMDSIWIAVKWVHEFIPR